jgi:diguanylate cyclase (GGDEF)-like protein/PAS domain S-box-containing protein
VTTDEHASGIPDAGADGRNQVLDLVLASLSAAVIAADGADRILFWNRPAEDLFGRPYADVAGHDFGAVVVHRDAREQFAGELAAVLSGQRVHSDLAIVRPDGERVSVVLDRTPVFDNDGVVVGWAAWAVDAADHRKRRRVIESHATQDPATGLLNRPALEEQLRLALDRASAQTDVAMAAMLIHLDGYAGTRESAGESAADRLLSDAAHRIRGALRAGDILGRLDDDFLLVMPELRAGSGYGLEEWSRASGVVVAKKIERAMESAFTVGNRELHLVPQVGLGVFPFDARDVPGLLTAANAVARAPGEN